MAIKRGTYRFEVSVSDGDSKSKLHDQGDRVDQERDSRVHLQSKTVPKSKQCN